MVNWSPLTALPRLLLISPTDYRSAVQKGVASLLADFDEGGFFDRVLIAFPLARTSCQEWVSPTVLVEDMGTDWMPFDGRWRWLRRAASPFHIVRTVFRMVGAVRRDGYQIVRATDPCFSGMFGWLTARLSGVPLCVSIHADFDKRHALSGASAGATVLGSRRLAKLIEGFVMRRAQLVLPIRESLTPYALKLGVKPERIRVIPHGTDLTAFVTPSGVDVRARFGIPAADRIVSFAGRLLRENYIDDVLAIARAVAATERDVCVLMIGGGPDESRLRATVDADPVLRSVVRLEGFQPREVVAALRQASAASLCLMGGFSLIEACAAASPVIAYDVEWHRELVENGRTGFLVPEGDQVAAAEAVRSVLRDPGLASMLGRNARELALARHAIDRTVAIKRECYRELLPLGVAP